MAEATPPSTEVPAEPAIGSTGPDAVPPPDGGGGSGDGDASVEPVASAESASVASAESASVSTLAAVVSDAAVEPAPPTSSGTSGAAAGSPPTGSEHEPARLLRFDGVERIVHWANATLFAIVGSTAAILYLPPLSAEVGRRELVVTIHVYAGLMLPFPLILGIIGPRYGWHLRADLRRLNRWIPEDRTWMRRHGWKQERVVGLKQGKFNAGQKLNAAFTGGAILLMLATGSIMHWFKPFPLEWRTGATFVHDWIAIALFFTISGHILFALSDRESMGSMLTGDISRSWAKRHAPRWLAEETKARRGASK